jgi:hypothetical protein
VQFLSDGTYPPLDLYTALSDDPDTLYLSDLVFTGPDNGTCSDPDFPVTLPRIFMEVESTFPLANSCAILIFIGVLDLSGV